MHREAERVQGCKEARTQCRLTMAEGSAHTPLRRRPRLGQLSRVLRSPLAIRGTRELQAGPRSGDRCLFSPGGMAEGASAREHCQYLGTIPLSLGV